MNITIETLRDDLALIRCEGRLDAAASDGFKARLTTILAEGNPCLALDMAGVPFIDSTGLGVLVSCLKAARRAEGDLRLIAPSTQVRKLLRLTAMDRVFAVSETLDVI